MEEIELSYVKGGGDDPLKTLDKYRNTEDIMKEDEQLRVDP